MQDDSRNCMCCEKHNSGELTGLYYMKCEGCKIRLLAKCKGNQTAYDSMKDTVDRQRRKIDSYAV